MRAWSWMPGVHKRAPVTRDGKRNASASAAIPSGGGGGLQPRLIGWLVRDIFVLLVSVLGYAQHAKPYCLQQPHSLPPESSILKAYPCGAGGPKRALYLVRNFQGVYYDLLRLGPSDRWASFQVMSIGLRIAAAVALPRSLYKFILKSFLSQIHRVIPLIYLLAVSYQGIPPSTAGLWYLASQPALDFLANVIFPVNPIAECVYGAVSMILIAAIWCRYSQLASAAATAAATTAAEASSTLLATTAQVCCNPNSIIAGLAAAGGKALSSISGGVGAGACVSAAATTGVGGGQSPYHLGTRLPFQLLMSATCTVVTLLLELWRSRPLAEETADVVGPAAAARDAAGVRPHNPAAVAGPSWVERKAPAPLGANAAGGKGASGDGNSGYDIGDSAAAASAQGRRSGDHGTAATWGASSSGGLPCGRRDVARCCRKMGGSGNEDAGVKHAAAAVATAAAAAEGSTATAGTTQQTPTHSTMRAAGAGYSQPPPPEGAAVAYLGAVANAWIGEGGGSGNRHSSAGTGTGEAAEARRGRVLAALEEAAAGTARWQAMPGNSSGVGSLCQDSELADGFMIGLLDATTEENDNNGGGSGTMATAWTWGDSSAGGGSRPGSGHAAADVARVDQLLRATTATTAAAAPTPVVGFASGGIADSGPTSSPAHATGASPLAAAAVAGAADSRNSSDDGAPRRDHDRVYQVVGSLASSTSQPSMPSPPNDHHQYQQPLQRRLSPPFEQLAAAQVHLAPLVAACAADGGPAAAAVVAAALQHARRPAYVPRVRMVTTHIKVHGAQPDQLTDGYTQRLEHVAGAAGRRLMGVYVRAGCIELVLDSADWGDERGASGPLPMALIPSEPSTGGGRDSGPLPAPLQSRPPVQPPYWSAPSTPSRLQRQYALQPQQPPDAMPLLAQRQQQQQPFLPNEAAGQLQGSLPTAGGIGVTGLSPHPGSSPSPGAAGGGYGVWPGMGSVHAGGNGGCSAGGADLDLGAVIRALRLHRAGGSAESTNDLVSELDLDLEYGDRVEHVGSGMNSGGSAGDSSSKEAPISGGASRRGGGGGGGALSPAALGLVQTFGGGGNSLQHNYLQQQLRQQQHQYPMLDGAVLPAPPPPPPPSATGMAASSGVISRQALVLGGPRDPVAPGIVALHPRVFVIPAAADADAAGPPTRFTAVVRRLGAVPAPPIPVGSAAPAAFATAAAADPEFTIRARGEYLPLRAVRLSTASVAVAVAGGVSGVFRELQPRSASAAVGVVEGSGVGLQGSGPPRVIVGRTSQGDSLEDTSRDFDVDTGPRRTDSGVDVARVAVAAPTVWMWHQSYMLELLEAPQSPGLLLADVRGGGADALPAAPRAVPLVAVSDPAIASELQAVEERWEGAPSELDDLLLDLGTWLHHMAPPQSPLAPAAVALRQGDPRTVTQGLRIAPAPPLDERLAALGRHLMSYAALCGWEATAASLRADLARYGILPQAHVGGSGAAAVAVAGGVAGGAADGDGDSLWAFPPPIFFPGLDTLVPEPAAEVVEAAAARTVAVPQPAPPRPQPPAQPRIQAAAASGGGGSFGRWVRRLLQRRVPLGAHATTRACAAAGAAADHLGPGAVAEAEAAEFRAFQLASMSSQIWVMTLLDLVSLAVLLFRGRREPLTAPLNITTLIACCTGAAMAAARLVLPFHRWLWLAEVTKVPRHVFYSLTKFLIGVVGFPAPPGITSYELGLSVVVFESVVVPWCCLVSIPTAVAVCAIKAPICMALWHRLATEALREAAEAEAEAKALSTTRLSTVALGSPEAEGTTVLTPAQLAVLRGFLSPYRRLARSLAMAGLFLFVTAACHAQVRAAYVRHKRRLRLVAGFAGVSEAAGLAGPPAAGESGGPPLKAAKWE